MRGNVLQLLFFGCILLQSCEKDIPVEPAPEPPVIDTMSYIGYRFYPEPVTADSSKIVYTDSNVVINIKITTTDTIRWIDITYGSFDRRYKLNEDSSFSGYGYSLSYGDRKGSEGIISSQSLEIKEYQWVGPGLMYLYRTYYTFGKRRE